MKWLPPGDRPTAAAIPVPPVSDQELMPLLELGSEAAKVAAESGRSSDQAFIAAVCGQQMGAIHDDEDFRDLNGRLRALAWHEAIGYRPEPIAKAGLITETAVGYEASKVYSAAISRMPLWCEFQSVDGGSIKLYWSVPDLINEAKKIEDGRVMNHRVELPVTAGERTVLHLRTSLIELMQNSLGSSDKSLGEEMESVLGDPVRFNVENFLEYKSLMQVRDQLLRLLKADERKHYENEAATWWFNPSANENLKGLSGMGFGPWHEWEALDHTPNWDGSVFCRTVLRSSVHASIPCKAGNFPSYYVACYGTISHLQQLLKIAPAAATTNSSSGWSVLGDLATLPRKSDQIGLLVRAGMDVDFGSPLGHTPLGQALRTHQFANIDALLRLGADPFLDVMTTPELFVSAAADPDCPQRLRQALTELSTQAPTSGTAKLLEEFEEKLRRMGAPSHRKRS